MKHGGNPMEYVLCDLCNMIWRDEKIPSEWKIATIVKLPRKEISAIAQTGEGFLFWW